MALIGGSNMLGSQVRRIAPLLAPRKITQTAPPPPIDGFTPAFEAAGSFGTPAKITNFTPGADPALDGGFGSPAKFNPADLFAPPMPAAIPQNTALPGQVPTMGGQMASLGGDWSGVDRWNATIQAAAAKHGVPANLIKAVMKLESGGDPNSVSVSGATGLMQIMPFWNGTGGYSIHDPVQNIMLGALILKQNYESGNPATGEPSWEWATRRYLGLGGPDAYGTDHNDYWDVISNNWNQLNGASGTAGLGFNPGGGGGGVLSLFGQGAAVHDWGEFAAPSGNGLYGYGTAYGLNGVQHTGLDVAMPFNTPFTAPMGGTVMCSGTGIGPGTDGGGCAAFSDTGNGGPWGPIQGVGRVEVLLDNGTVLIFGHSRSAALRPGTRFNAGQVIGYSGGMNGPHIHLEARVRDGSTSSGWRIVDPRTVLGGGGGFMQQPGTSNPYAQQGASQPTSFRQGLQAFKQGSFY